MRKIFIKIAIFLRYLMRGLHNADVEAFEGKTQESEDGTTVEQQQETNNVYQNLLKGEVTQAVNEAAFLADTVEHFRYFRPAAVNEHNIYADRAKKNYIGHYGVTEFLIYHSISAVFYYDCFVLIFLNVG